MQTLVQTTVGSVPVHVSTDSPLKIRHGCIKFIKSVGKNIKWGRGEGNIIAVGTNIEKWDKGSNIIFPIILRLLGRISSGEEDGHFWEENQDLNNGCGEEYQVLGNFIILKSGTSTRRTKKAGLLSSTILLKGGS